MSQRVKVIEEAKASETTKLDLSWKNLINMPPDLFHLASLMERVKEAIELCLEARGAA